MHHPYHHELNLFYCIVTSIFVMQQTKMMHQSHHAGVHRRYYHYTVLNQTILGWYPIPKHSTPHYVSP